MKVKLRIKIGNVSKRSEQPHQEQKTAQGLRGSSTQRENHAPRVQQFIIRLSALHECKQERG